MAHGVNQNIPGSFPDLEEDFAVELGKN